MAPVKLQPEKVTLERKLTLASPAWETKSRAQYPWCCLSKIRSWFGDRFRNRAPDPVPNPAAGSGSPCGGIDIKRQNCAGRSRGRPPSPSGLG
jgi:hypothetical protein